MNRHVKNISARLSLRPPQRISLETLDAVLQLTALKKGADLDAALGAIRVAFPQFEDFERKFLNLCFSLATGVGKTRLMGAFIAYLHLQHGIRHFFVLAPNLTIYNKLVTDFTPNTSKYVFEGVTEFAVRPPVLITGENWESGIGIRDDLRQGQMKLFDAPVHVNVFNISKMIGQGDSTQLRKLRSIREVFGESYFDYLSGLDDLVVLMDEAHRYRADKSMAAIDGLKPLLGLELTATPHIETNRGPVRFKNVIYDYPLATAMKDGFVKEPAVASREDLTPAQARAMAETNLERMKLEDGVRIHEDTKAALATYAINMGKARIKPFILIIAKDTTHAGDLVKLIESDDFFAGRYKGRVIEVHSGKSGAEKDDVVEQLLSVEKSENPIEIVVHVNMLKEGWDVTNLYTIVPLRAANSKTLVEQSIGRGLRLPYGRRTGVSAVDRLTIVAHDHFQEIVDEAKKGGYTFNEIKLRSADTSAAQRAVVVNPVLDELISGAKSVTVLDESPAVSQPNDPSTPPIASPFPTPAEQTVARTTIQVIQSQAHQICTDLGRPTTPSSLNEPEVRRKLVEQVKHRMDSIQTFLPNIEPVPDLTSIVARTAALYLSHTIAVPRIVVLPKGNNSIVFTKFTLDTSAIRFPPVSETVVIQHLASEQLSRLGGLDLAEHEQRLEDYVVRGLIDYDDISYDDHADLLYDLAGQVSAHLRGYLSSDADVRNVLLYHQKTIVDHVHAQMQTHAAEPTAEYQVTVSQGFSELKAQAYNAASTESVRPFREPIGNRSEIREMLFGGFNKCLYPVVRFDSDSERRFAVVLENDRTVLKWSKPGRGVFRIAYHKDHEYEPDFVVETDTEKLLVEPKRADQLQDDVVRAKAKAAALWCARATEYEIQSGGKPWRYLLVPHDAISDNMTIVGLSKTYTIPSVEHEAR